MHHSSDKEMESEETCGGAHRVRTTLKYKIPLKRCFAYKILLKIKMTIIILLCKYLQLTVSPYTETLKGTVYKMYILKNLFSQMKNYIFKFSNNISFTLEISSFNNWHCTLITCSYNRKYKEYI